MNRFSRAALIALAATIGCNQDPVAPRRAEIKDTPDFAVITVGGGPTYLSTLGFAEGLLEGINNNGDAVGTVRSPGNSRAAFYPASGSPIILASLGGNQSNAAFAINSAGVIVGSSTEGSGVAWPVYWGVGASAPVRLLGGPGPRNNLLTAASDINDAGLIVGYIGSGSGTTDVAAYWDLSRTFKQLALPGGATGAQAHGVNALGDIVGYATFSSVQNFRPVLWSAQSGYVPQLLQLTPNFSGGQALAISDAGVIVGAVNNSVSGGVTLSPSVWQDAGSTPRVIGGPAQWIARDVNADGTVVGGSALAWVWSPESGLIALTSSGSAAATEINDNGVAVGYHKRSTVFEPTQWLVNAAPPDQDRDGVTDAQDNCPSEPNGDQADTDQDGRGDACDPFPNDPENDVDGDRISGDVDNCRLHANAEQQDGDGDGLGDACDAFPRDPENDVDGDGISGDVDNCRLQANAGQEDADGDRLGDACDPFPKDAENDVDGDGVPGNVDNCPREANPVQEDSDSDGIGDKCDLNNPPTVDAGRSYTGVEGGVITFTGTASDPDRDALTYAWDFNGDGVKDATTLSGQHRFRENGFFIARLTVNDGTHLVESLASVTVSNIAPEVTAIRLPATPIALGTPATIGVDFTDPGLDDTHTAVVDWEGATTSPAIAAGARTFNATHTFTQPGVYSVRVTVTDDDGDSGIGTSSLELSAYIVVFDPSGGFVTGGGSIMSPAGACRMVACSETITGKASFGFVSRYHKGASIPSGNTEFHFKAGNLRFSSTSYEWLVVAGMKAMYRGEGTVNGAGRYGFMITAIDGKDDNRPDKFRIKIWDLTSGGVIYDNKMGSAEDSDDATEIDAGSIVIHKS